MTDSKPVRRFVIDVERTLRTYAVMWRAAGALLGGRGAPPAAEQIMAAGVLGAFSFEAYLNHVGVALLDCWPELERIRWEGKLQLITEQLAIPLDRGAFPYQALRELFTFRNALAHGRTDSAKLTDLPPPAMGSQLSRELRKLVDHAHLPWEKQCEPARVREWMRAVETMITTIHHKFRAHPKVCQVFLGGDRFPEPADPFSSDHHGRATLRVSRALSQKVPAGSPPGRPARRRPGVAARK